MDQVFVVTYPRPLPIEARRIEHEDTPEGGIALAYFFRGNLLARGVVTTEGAEAVNRLLEDPVPVALAVTEDDGGNIEARVCLMVPVDPDMLGAEEAESADEPWKASVPAPPPEVESSYRPGAEGDDEDRPQYALFPIGNVIRHAENREHPDNVVEDAQQMLKNLLTGRAQDAVERAIDDLLRGI